MASNADGEPRVEVSTPLASWGNPESTPGRRDSRPRLLVDRINERNAIDDLLERFRDGLSGVLVLHGGAGVPNTTSLPRRPASPSSPQRARRKGSSASDHGPISPSGCTALLRQTWLRPALITAAPAARVPAPNGDGRARVQLRDRDRRTWPGHRDRNCRPGQRHRDRHGRCRLRVPKARRAEDSGDRDHDDQR